MVSIYLITQFTTEHKIWRNGADPLKGPIDYAQLVEFATYNVASLCHRDSVWIAFSGLITLKDDDTKYTYKLRTPNITLSGRYD